MKRQKAAVSKPPASEPAPDAGLGYSDILNILRIVNEAAALEKFHLEVAGLKLHVQRGGSGTGHHDPAPAGMRPQAPSPAATVVSNDAVPSSARNALTSPKSPEVSADVVAIKSSVVGCFYRAPSPGAAPFVQVGARVKQDDQVGIIEVMKLMTAIKAPAGGIVREILVEDSALVEYGQILMTIEPER